MCLIEKIRSIEHKYRRFYKKKLHVYKMWQSFDYFNRLYLTLYFVKSVYFEEYSIKVME